MHEIACAIADYGAAYSTEVRYHQLAVAVVRGCGTAGRINYFNDEFVFVDMDRFRLKSALKAERANFSGASVIEALCAPGFFDEFLGARNTRPRLAGVLLPPQQS